MADFLRRKLPSVGGHGDLRLKKDAVTVIWNIVDFKVLDHRSVITSPSINVRDAKFNFKIVKDDQTPSNFVLSLCRSKRKTKYSRITYHLSLVLNEKHFCQGFAETCDFGENTSSECMRMNEIDFLGSMSSNSFAIFCTLCPEDEYLAGMPEEISTDICQEVTVSSVINESLKVLSLNMKDLLFSRYKYDLIVKVQNREFFVHKTILYARSPIFSSLLQRNLTKVDGKISDMSTYEPDVLEKFLIYLYSGQVGQLSWNEVIQLYKLGNDCGLEPLRRICVEFMENNMCTKAFFDVLALAGKHNISSLMRCVERFFLKNARSILQTAEWALFIQKHPYTCSKLFLKYTEENN